MKKPCVYMMASKMGGALYIGVTSNLARRVWQHKNGMGGKFTKQYYIHRLVWYEQHPTMESAILREKQIKRWERKWKVELILEKNRHWRDLYKELFEGGGRHGRGRAV